MRSFRATVLLAANAKFTLSSPEQKTRGRHRGGARLEGKSHGITRGLSARALSAVLSSPPSNLWSRRSRALCAEPGAQRRGLGSLLPVVLAAWRYACRGRLSRGDMITPTHMECSIAIKKRARGQHSSLISFVVSALASICRPAISADIWCFIWHPMGRGERPV